MAERRRLLFSDYREQAVSTGIYDNECDACRFEGIVSEGIGFCNVCREFLCDECKRVHRRSRATRDHDLVDGDLLRNIRSQEPPQPFALCLKHPGQFVNFFCATHDSVFCADCRVLTHGGCREVKTISAETTRNAITFRTEAEKLMEKIQSMTVRISIISDERKGHLIQLEKHKQKILQEITDIRHGINKLLERLEKEVKHTVISMVTNEANKLQDDLSTLNTIKSSLDRDMFYLDAAKSTGNNEKLFLAMKRTTGPRELKPRLDSMDKEQFAMKMDFTVHPLLQEIVSSLQSIGSLEAGFIKRPHDILPASQRERAVMEVAQRDVQLHCDKRTCTITGSVFLSSGESLLCDYSNDNVKLLNAEITVQAGVKLTSGPWDVAMVTEQDVVISLPDEKKLQYVTVPGLKPGRKVKIGRPCYGLAVHEDQIYVTCHDGPRNGEILVLEKNGAIKRRIGRTGNGNYRFTSPYYIAVDALGETMFVSDWFEHSVTCLTVEGGPVYHCVLEGAVFARDLLVDSEDGVLVCSKDSSTASLQFLTPEGNPCNTKETWPREIWDPLSLCYRSRDRTLLVGMWKSNKILVYRCE